MNSSLKQLEKRIEKLETKEEQGTNIIVHHGEPDPVELERLHKEHPGAVIMIIDHTPDMEE